MSERFFILGSQRSGTTLLRLILETHPRIFCYDETTAYAKLTSGDPDDAADNQLVGFKIPRWTEQMLEPRLADEGINETCANFYRGEKILFLIRNAKDNVASMRKLRFGEIGWIEQWIPRVLLRKFADQRFRDAYQADLRIAADSGSFLIACAALSWKYKTASFFEYKDKGLPLLPIFYEDLVSKPQVVLTAICEYLGVEWDDALLRHHEAEHTEVSGEGLTVGNTDPRKPINIDSVDRWEQVFTPGDIAAIDEITSGLTRRIQLLRSTLPES